MALSILYVVEGMKWEMLWSGGFLRYNPEWNAQFQRDGECTPLYRIAQVASSKTPVLQQEDYRGGRIEISEQTELILLGCRGGFVFQETNILYGGRENVAEGASAGIASDFKYGCPGRRPGRRKYWSGRHTRICASGLMTKTFSS
jgi:hypothetical protein